MTPATAKPLTGRKVAIGMIMAFSIIIGVNLTLAFQAVATFPGLETKNSYIASQAFEADRAAQAALGWEVSAVFEGDELVLSIQQGGVPQRPQIQSAILGRATSVAQDQQPQWRYEAGSFRAPVRADGGNWNLRLVALAEDGTLFRQRVIVAHSE